MLLVIGNTTPWQLGSSPLPCVSTLVRSTVSDGLQRSLETTSSPIVAGHSAPRRSRSRRFYKLCRGCPTLSVGVRYASGRLGQVDVDTLPWRRLVVVPFY